MQDLIGHSGQLKTLWQMARKERLPHALLFSGPARVGKYTAALEFANKLLVEKSKVKKETPPNQSHPDLHILTRESDKKEIKVDEVREFTEKLYLKPYYGGYTVGIINEADLMNTASCNSLLKTLEEPPSYCKLILVSSKSQRLLETIISRCQRVRFGYLKESELKEVVTIICNTAGLDDNAASELCNLCNGSLANLHLDNFVDPVGHSITKSKKLEKHLTQIAKLVSDCKAVINKSLPSFRSPTGRNKMLLLADAFSSKKEELPIFWELFHEELREKMIHSNSLEESKHWAEIQQQAIEAKEKIMRQNLNVGVQLAALGLSTIRN